MKNFFTNLYYRICFKMYYEYMNGFPAVIKWVFIITFATPIILLFTINSDEVIAFGFFIVEKSNDLFTIYIYNYFYPPIEIIPEPEKPEPFVPTVTDEIIVGLFLGWYFAAIIVDILIGAGYLII